MVNIPLPQSFEDLKTYQDKFNNNYTVYVNETNKLQKTVTKQQILINSSNYQTDWSLMNQVTSSFTYFVDSSLIRRNSFLGVSTMFIDYQVLLNNVTENIIPTIKTQIFIQSGSDGKGPTRPLYNFSSIAEPKSFTILQTNPDSTVNLLIEAGLLMSVSTVPPGLNQNYPDGFGPLPDYYSKFILTISNIGAYT